MRMFTRLTALIALAMSTLVSAQAPETAVLVSAARRALGGDTTLAAVTSFTVSGSLGRSVGPGFTVAVEYKCALPDRFVRVERQVSQLGPLGTSDITSYLGFNGNDPIRDQVVNSPLPLPPDPDEPTTPAEIAAQQEKRTLAGKRIFGQLAVPLFVTSFAGYPVDYTAAGLVNLPSGPADVLDVHGPAGKTWRLFVDAATHLPVRLTWMDKPLVTFSASTSTRYAVDSRGNVLSPPTTGTIAVPVGDPSAGLADVEWQIAISDYKVSDALNWPHRLITTYGGKKYEDLRLGKFTINPKISPSTFKPTR